MLKKNIHSEERILSIFKKKTENKVEINSFVKSMVYSRV